MGRAIGLAWLTVPELAPPQQVAAAAQAGYTHVGLRLVPLANQVLPPLDERETERRLADTAVKVLDVEVFRLTAETNVAQFESTLAVAARLGATDLLVHGDDVDAARLSGTFARLCELARRYRLWANLEPMPWVEVSTAVKAKRLLDAAGCENGALLVDAIHFFRAENELSELEALPRRHFRYMQLCDARAERPADMQEIIRQARGDRLFPGEGGLDLRGLLRALPAELPISLEVPCAKPMPPFERAALALQKTKVFLACASRS